MFRRHQAGVRPPSPRHRKEPPMPPTIAWDLDPSRWDALVAADPAASVFHTPAWYRAHAAALGYQPLAAWLRFGSGREAVLPLAVKGRFRGLVRTAHAGV